MDRMDILANIDNPRQLEKLYRDNKATFKSEFNALYPELTDLKVAAYWRERLDYEGSEISWGSNKELTFVIFAALIAGLIAKIPAFFSLDQELFYQRNAGFIFFPVLTAYFIWKKNLSVKKIAFALPAFLVSLVFINALPADSKSDTMMLSCVHLPLFLWSVLGFTYVGDNIKSYSNRLDYLRFNGDLMIVTALILISGAILTGITIGLFSVIGYNIETFYFEYFGIFGLAAAPVVGTYLTQTNPQLVNKVSPVIAKIFSPLVLIMLVIYLVAMFFSGKDPYNDREFLMIFNLLLIGVMALILFSVAESFRKNENRTGSYLLLALSVVTVIVNGIALSAILFRISEWGMTPNRAAVLGANVLMLANLLIVAFRLFQNVSKKADIGEVENSISMFLPVYMIWTAIVIFIFPFIFQFK
jgi:hypothetical protein